MATVDVQPDVRIHEATPEEGREIVDRAARRELGMSGKEFLRRWDAGEIEDPDRPEILRVAMLLPFVRPERG